MADQIAGSRLLREPVSTRSPSIGLNSYLTALAGLSSAVRATTARRDLAALAVDGPSEVRNLAADFNALIASLATELDERGRAEGELRLLNSALEIRLAKGTEELEAANLDLEAFSYAVAHDLRAPLRAIDGFAEILESEHSAELSSVGVGHLRRLRKAAARMATLIRDLLEFSRLSRTGLQRGPVALRPIVNRVVRRLVAGSPGRKVNVEIGELAACDGDEELLEQVVANLLSNAWKFTVGEKEARVEIGSEVVAGISSYYVRDNGIGFDPGFAGKVFEAFQRAHSTDDFPGTGIGLASVKRIVLRHGGRVWAESQPGQGATFHFTLGGSRVPDHRGEKLTQPATARELNTFDSLRLNQPARRARA